MLDELTRIIDFINAKVEWNKLEKIRYAYVELGKLVSKDVFFFYTIQNNLANGKEKLQYDIDTIREIVNSTDRFNYKVVCKSSAEMLKYIFDHTGIDSEIKKTVKTEIYESEGQEVAINHYFLVATGDDDKKYFMTLNPDIHNIKINKRTSHFGNYIPYIQRETLVDENGKKYTSSFQAYEGEEIKATCLSYDEIRQLDEKIGYQFIDFNGEQVYTDELFDILEKNYSYNPNTLNSGEYLYIVSHETPFYYDLCRLLNGKKTMVEILNDDHVPTKEEIDDSYIDFDNLSLDEKNLSDLKTFLILEVITRLFQQNDVNLNDDVYSNYLQMLEAKDYDNMIEEIIKTFKGMNVTALGPYNPITQFRKTIKLITIVDDIINQKEVNDRRNSIKKFNNSLIDILLIFVPNTLLPSPGKRLNSSYITNKIIRSFEKVFDIGHLTDFNHLELAEQIEIIKDLLPRIFTDTKLNIKDLNIDEYNEKKSALNNRIYSTVLFHKETNDPYYLLIVKDSLLEKSNSQGKGLVPIIFDLKRNTLSTDKSMTEIYDIFYIIKDKDFDLMVEQIEKSNK